jgi:hypothetical protein
MDDKWFIYFEEPYLFLHRSWTGEPAYRLALSETHQGAVVSEALWCKSNESGSVFDLSSQAPLVDFLLSNLILGKGKPFPVPSTASRFEPGVLQHSVAGSGFPEVALKPIGHGGGCVVVSNSALNRTAVTLAAKPPPAAPRR